MTPIPTGLRDEYRDLLRPYQRRTMENLLGSRYFKVRRSCCFQLLTLSLG
jgi:hypothetical protein